MNWKKDRERIRVNWGYEMQNNDEQFVVFFRGKFYRAAGYREPKPGETYLSADGKVKRQPDNGGSIGHRTVVREINLKEVTYGG